MTTNHVHVYEVLDGQEGELWDTISWVSRAGIRTDTGMEWKIDVDYPLPQSGIFYVVNPIRPDERVNGIAYELPDLKNPNYKHIGQLMQESDFTPELKASWEALPDTAIIGVWGTPYGTFTLNCRKSIIDPLMGSVIGQLYLYRPDSLRLATLSVIKPV